MGMVPTWRESPPASRSGWRRMRSCGQVRCVGLWWERRGAARTRGSCTLRRYTDRGLTTAVRVLDCDGFGSFEDIVDAMNWIATNVSVRPPLLSSTALCTLTTRLSTENIVCGVYVQGPSVVVMSLSGAASTTVDAAANALVDAGIPVRSLPPAQMRPLGSSGTTHLYLTRRAVGAAVCCGQVVVAAGNDGINSCERSPARAAKTITVGATDSFDEAPSWSNYGACVTMHAPGARAPHAARFPLHDLGDSRRPGCTG
jgi:subtilisin family serine protease